LASPPGAGMARRMPPPIPPASAKPTLKPRPGHRRSRSYDPNTLRMTLVRPFDPIQSTRCLLQASGARLTAIICDGTFSMRQVQARTMEDHPRSVMAPGVHVVSDGEDSDGDGDGDSGLSISGGGGLGMMSMCLGVHPSVRSVVIPFLSSFPSPRVSSHSSVGLCSYAEAFIG
jgi:hypothetical protein